MTASTKLTVSVGLPNKHRKYYLPGDLTVNHALSIAEAEDQQLNAEIERGAVAVIINGEVVDDYYDVPLSHGQIITVTRQGG